MYGPARSSQEYQAGMNVDQRVVFQILTLSLQSLKSTFSQPFEEKCIGKVVREFVV